MVVLQSLALPSSPFPVPWVSLAWFGALLLFSYFAIFKALAHQWSVDEDVSHGFFVPLVSAYIAWQKRDEILGQQWIPNYFGALIVLWGSLQLIIGSLGAELFLQRTSFVIILIFMTILINKQRVMKEWTNSKFYNVVAWSSVALMIGLTLALVGISIRDMFAKS